MRVFVYIWIYAIAMVGTFTSCKKDSGLTEDQKASFIKFYGVDAEGVDFKETADGGFILLGHAGGAIFLVKTDGYGNIQWQKSFRGINTDSPSSNSFEVADAIALTPSGGYAIIGTTTETTQLNGVNIEVSKAILLILKSNGSLERDPLFFEDKVKFEDVIGTGIVFRKNGNLVVCCTRVNTDIGSERGLVYELSANDYSVENFVVASILEKGTNPGDSIYANVRFEDVIIDNTDSLCFIGRTSNETAGALGINISLISFKNFQTGSSEAAGIYGSSGLDEGYDLALNDDGRFVGVGFVTEGDQQAYIFETGALVSDDLTWEERIGSTESGNSIAYGVSNSAGGYLVTGSAEVSGYSKQMFVAKVDLDGNELWKKYFGYVRDDVGRSVTETKDGNIAIFGTASDDRDNLTMCLIKTDPNGELIDN